MFGKSEDPNISEIPQNLPQWGDRAVVLVPKIEHLEDVSQTISADRSNAALAAWVAHDPKLMESPVRHRRPGR